MNSTLHKSSIEAAGKPATVLLLQMGLATSLLLHNGLTTDLLLNLIWIRILHGLQKNITFIISTTERLLRFCKRARMSLDSANNICEQV